MSLILPTVGQEPGPNWALDLNSSLSLVDQHNHASGSGVQITPAGINISVDLPFSGNNATGLKSARFDVQGSPLAGGLDIGCIYVSGQDLYYNDTLGNQIQLTASGAINGTPGAIGNLVAPAAVTYVPANQTVIFESNQTNSTPASIDVGNIFLRNITPGSNYINIQPNAVLPSNYSLTLPSALPSVNSVLVSDNIGNITFNALSSLLPSGVIMMYGGTAVPTGWLFCDGSVVSQLTYASLFSTIGTAFDTGGEGAGNFRLPDFRRRVPVGSGGTGSAILGNLIGNTGGAESVAISVNEMPSHDHGGSTGSISLTFSSVTNYGFGGATALAATGSNSHSHTISSQGGGQAHNNIQPSLIVNYIIKY
jgi:microcystin-dependent protein